MEKAKKKMNFLPLFQGPRLRAGGRRGFPCSGTHSPEPGSLVAATRSPPALQKPHNPIRSHPPRHPLHHRPPCRCRPSPYAPAPPPAAPRRRRPAPRTLPPPEGACCVPPARSDAGEPALSGPLPLSSRSRKSPAPRLPPVNQLLLPLSP